ncbi:MAG TPA: hypothetical protein VI432_02915, partial [Candidatus Paceibacterota bacterium]
MNSKTLLWTTLVILNFALAGCVENPMKDYYESDDSSSEVSTTDETETNSEEQTSSKENNSPEDPPPEEANHGGGTENEGSPEEPTPEGELPVLEIGVEATNLRREVDGYSATTGMFTFSAEVAQDGPSINWLLDSENIGIGSQISHELTEPGNYLIKALLETATGDTI